MNKERKLNNTLIRILVGIIGIPLIVLIILKGGIIFFLFTFILNTACLYEFFKMFEKKEIYPQKNLGIILSSISMLLYFIDIKYSLAALLISFVMLSFLEIFRDDKVRSPLSPGISLFSFVYISLSMLMLNVLEQNSMQVLLILILIWVNDSFAFFIGKLLGKHKLSSISPNKTIEGFIGGVVFTAIASIIIFKFKIIDINMIDLIVFTFVATFFGTAGDIFESMLKRFAGIKDSSNIIPGHGGVLDRFDSLIFIIPILFIYIELIKIFL